MLDAWFAPFLDKGRPADALSGQALEQLCVQLLVKARACVGEGDWLVLRAGGGCWGEAAACHEVAKESSEHASSIFFTAFPPPAGAPRRLVSMHLCVAGPCQVTAFAWSGSGWAQVGAATARDFCKLPLKLTTPEHLPLQVRPRARRWLRRASLVLLLFVHCPQPVWPHRAATWRTLIKQRDMCLLGPTPRRRAPVRPWLLFDAPPGTTGRDPAPGRFRASAAGPAVRACTSSGESGSARRAGLAVPCVH